MSLIIRNELIFYLFREEKKVKQLRGAAFVQTDCTQTIFKMTIKPVPTLFYK